MLNKLDKIREILKGTNIKDIYFENKSRIIFELEDCMPFKFELLSKEVDFFKDLGIDKKGISDAILTKDWIET